MATNIEVILLDYYFNDDSIFKIFPDEILFMILNDFVIERVTLVSTDKKSFRISKKVARISILLRSMLELGYVDHDTGIPSSTDSKTLIKVIEYMEYESKHPTKDKVWIKKFLNVPQVERNWILRTANYLNIPSLTDAICFTIASEMRGLTTIELCKKLGF